MGSFARGPRRTVWSRGFVLSLGAQRSEATRGPHPAPPLLESHCVGGSLLCFVESGTKVEVPGDDERRRG